MNHFESFPILQKIAGSDSTVLITGPTGTGKSFLAEQIHNRSPRKERKFIAINLATLNENLLESELFGHERGAFSGANARRLGKLEIADGGTVFLDEIGELSLAMQTRLLEVLNSKVISPVGSNRELKLNIRIIAATNRDLSEMVAREEFRSDLFFRINTFQVELPPISASRELIRGYCDIFLKQAAAQSRESERKSFSGEFIKFCEAYSWPGNLREIKNAIEYAHTVSSGNTLLLEDLPPYINRDASGKETASGEIFPINYHQAKDLFERSYLEQMLGKFAGKINLTARETQLSKVTLIDKIRRYNIDVNSHRIAAYGKSKQNDLLRYL